MKQVIFVLLSLIIISTSFSLVVVNSNSWQAIYLGVEYAKYHHEKFIVLSSSSQVRNVKDKDITLIDYNEKVPNAISLFEVLGKRVDEITANSITDLEMKLFNGNNNFCIVGSEYGYKAVVLSPLYTKCTIIFYERSHINELVSFLDHKDVTLYVNSGYLTDKLSEAGIKYTVNNESYVNLDLDVFKEYNETKLVNFISISSVDPTILFYYPIILSSVNTNNVVDVLQHSNVKAVVIIGKDPMQLLSMLRPKLTHVSFLIKYGEVVVSSTGSYHETAVPLFNFVGRVNNLEVSKVFYNSYTKNLIVELNNTGNSNELYFTTLSNGKKDSYIHLINKHSLGFDVFRDVNYNKQINGTTVYGPNIPLSFFVDNGSWIANVTTINFNPTVNVTKFYFNESDYNFYLFVKSNNKYIYASLIGNLNSGHWTITSNITKATNNYAVVKIPTELSINELKKMPSLRVVVYSGINENALDVGFDKEIKYGFVKLPQQQTDNYTYVFVLLSVAILFGVIYLFVKRMKK